MGVWLTRGRFVQLFRNMAVLYSEGLLHAYSNTCTSLLRQKEKLQAPENQMLVTIDTTWISKELKFTFLLSQVWFHLILLTTSNHFISPLFFSSTCLLVMVQMLCFKILIRGNGLGICVTNRCNLCELKPCTYFWVIVTEGQLLFQENKWGASHI